ncbi:hypothetical protein WJX73_005875 [Symbiochloris irregularis]|uniref:Uncharacterized protein n=1 Tax=Symbiochloris irregularis TaxID=706552 RepID=A0AAW1PYM8_9CHLO
MPSAGRLQGGEHSWTRWQAPKSAGALSRPSRRRSGARRTLWLAALPGLLFHRSTWSTDLNVLSPKGSFLGLRSSYTSSKFTALGGGRQLGMQSSQLELEAHVSLPQVKRACGADCGLGRVVGASLEVAAFPDEAELCRTCNAQADNVQDRLKQDQTLLHQVTLSP